MLCMDTFIMKNHYFEYQNQQDFFVASNRDQKQKLFWKLFLKHKSPCLWIINPWCKKNFWTPFFLSEPNYLLQSASGYPVINYYLSIKVINLVLTIIGKLRRVKVVSSSETLRSLRNVKFFFWPNWTFFPSSNQVILTFSHDSLEKTN